MARIIRGTRKDEKVHIADVEGEFALLGNGVKIRLGMIQADRLERGIIEDKYQDSETFKLHYDFDHFQATGRFKKHHWASARA